MANWPLKICQMSQGLIPAGIAANLSCSLYISYFFSSMSLFLYAVTGEHEGPVRPGDDGQSQGARVCVGRGRTLCELRHTKTKVCQSPGAWVRAGRGRALCELDTQNKGAL